MKFKNILYLILFFNIPLAFAQTSPTVTPLKYSIKLNLNQLLTQKAGLSFERIVSPKKTYFLSLAYIYSTRNHGDFIWEWARSPALYYKGVYSSFGYKYSYVDKRNTNKYLSTQVNLIYKEYNHINLIYGDADRNKEVHLSQFKSSIGLQENIGIINQDDIGSIECFFGAGFKVVNAHTQYISCSRCFNDVVNKSDRLKGDEGLYIVPTLHFGIVVGLSW
jgi:hypothetical protein